MKSPCPQYADQILDERWLSREERDRLEKHAAVCRACGESLDLARKLGSTFSASPPATCPPDFAPSVMRAIGTDASTACRPHLSGLLSAILAAQILGLLIVRYPLPDRIIHGITVLCASCLDSGPAILHDALSEALAATHYFAAPLQTPAPTDALLAACAILIVGAILASLAARGPSRRHLHTENRP